jgi:hypothetical protein
MRKSKYIRYQAFSKRFDKEMIVISCADSEQKDIKTLYDLFLPETIIEIREYNSGVLLEEIPLEVIFSKPKT